MPHQARERGFEVPVRHAFRERVEFLNRISG
jgi:hypothetical protein